MHPLRRAAWPVIFFCLAAPATTVVLASTPSIPVEAQVVTDEPATPAPLFVRPEWHRSTFGTGIGVAGLYVVDLAGPGAKRVVATAGRSGDYDNFWYVLVYRGGRYVHEWTSAPYPQAVRALRVANLDGDPALEVVVAAGSRIYVYDGTTHDLQWSFPTAASEILGLAVADVDSDGQQELALCDTSRFFVHHAATGVQEYASAAGLGGVDLAVANVDLDAAQEIVVANGDYSTGFVVDGQTHAVEWGNPWGFGSRVALGDLDGDGRSEVVAGSYQQIRIFDVDLQSLAASLPTARDADGLQVLDVEGDGPLEIVYRDGGGGRIWVLDGSTRAVKWSVPDPGGEGEVAFGDSDGDGTTEFLWGSGSYDSGRLHVWNAVTRLPEWTSLDINGPFRALSWGDVDADGRPEILSGSFESDGGYGDGLWFVHDARTHAEEFQSGPTTGSNGAGLTRILHANVDADPQHEIFVATSYSWYTGLIICYDGVSHGEEWRAAVPYGFSIASLALADVDLDGEAELVAGVKAETGAGGVFVVVFDAATGVEEWMSPQFGSAFGELPLLRVAKLDGDAQPEILAGGYGYNGALFLIDVVTQVVNHLGDHDLTALETPDLNGDGLAEIVIGTQAGAVQVLDSLGNVVQTLGNYGGQIDGLALADLDLDRRADHAYAINGEVFIRSGADGSLLWQSGLIGDGVGVRDSLYVADVDEDGVQELLVNIGSTGFRLYGVTTDRIFTDGFE